MTAEAAGPKILATGFGPFPGARENPTQALMRALAPEPPEEFGASTFRALVLPTDYRRSWAALRRAYARFAPDIVVHFGLSAKAEAIAVERFGRLQIRTDRLDAAGFFPRSGRARRSGPETLPSNFPVDAIVAALQDAGFPAVASEDAGGYVCNATLYRSLIAAQTAGMHVGMVHVPPGGAHGITERRLVQAAKIVATSATAAWAQAALKEQAA